MKKALVKKHQNALLAEQKSRSLMLKEQKQSIRFSLPDALPENKRPRKHSPRRGPCLLSPGTPTTLPPRVPKPWNKQGAQCMPGTATVEPEGDRLAQPWSPKTAPSGLNDSSTVAKKKKVNVGRPSKRKRSPPPRVLQPRMRKSAQGTPTAESKGDGLVAQARSPELGPSGLNDSSTVAEKIKVRIGRRPKKKSRKQTKRIRENRSESEERNSAGPGKDSEPDVQCDVEIELIGFESESSAMKTLVCSPQTSEIHTPNLTAFSQHNDFILLDQSFEQQLLAYEQVLEYDEGSETEEDSGDDDVMDISSRRTAAECPANAKEVLTSDILALLEELDGRDDTELRGIADNAMLNFSWSNDREVFTGQREAFTEVAGPTFATENLSPLEIFSKIWDEEIVEEIVRETNRYANKFLDNPNLSLHSRIRQWKDVTREELWKFFGLIMLEGIYPLPVEKEYWYPSLPYIKVANFGDFMTYSRFLLIKKFLHFVNNQSLPQVSNEEKKLLKIKPIVDHLNAKFRSLYQPEQTISIDESLLLWKGRLSFAQLITNKAAKVGIKSYELCESKSGYLWKMIIYTGKKDKSVREESAKKSHETTSAASKIVFELMQPLLDKGYTLVMDNFYNSPLLSRMLKARKTDTMGTLRLNRAYVPKTLRNKSNSNMRVGEIVYSQTNDLTVAVWNDAKMVGLISTYHKMDVGGKDKHGTYKYKPNIVLDYNLSMGGVDKRDQLLQAFPVERIRNSIWYKKLFRRLFNVSIHNAFVIYSSQKTIVHRQFRLQLADQILRSHVKPKPQSLVPKKTGHFPLKITQGRPRCYWCRKNKKDSRSQWQCDTCLVSLCLIGCFRDYHLSLL